MSTDVPAHSNNRNVTVRSAGVPVPRPRPRPADAVEGAAPEQGTAPPPEQEAGAAQAAPEQERPRRARPVTTTVLVALAAALVIVGAACGAAGAALWPPTFAARTEILYPITQEQPTGFLRDDRNLTTQVVLLSSRTVLGPVAAQLRIPVEDLQRSLTVDLVSGSEVLQIEARDRSPEVAMAVVTAVLDRYLTVEGATAPSDARAYLQTQLDGVRAELGRRPTGPNAAADPVTQALLAREQQLLSQVDESTVVDVSGPRAQVLAPPYPVDRAVSPRVDLAAAAGALAGALLAAAAIGYLLRRRSP